MPDRDRRSSDIGTELSAARARKNLTLSDLSRRTKINSQTLQAIERNEFTRVPGGIFVRGYLRAYAREVGLDAEEIVARYVSQYDAPPPPATAAEPPRSEQAPGPRADQYLIDPDSERRQRIAWTAATIAVLVGGVFYSVWVARDFPLVIAQDRRAAAAASSPAPSAPADTASVPAPAEQPVATAGTVDAAAANTTAAALSLEVRPRGPCWISAFADGRQVLYRLMAADEHERVEARDEIVLRVGDGAVCAFSINGVQARPLAGAGEARTVRLTPQNYSQYVDR